MTTTEELELLLRIVEKHNLPMSPILEYAIKEKMEKCSVEERVLAYVNDDKAEEGDIPEDVFKNSFMPKSYDIKWFCLSALTCLKGQMDYRTYQILSDTLRGESRKTIADKYDLTQERIRQIVVKATKQAGEMLVEQRNNLEKEREENARLNVQLNLMTEEVVKLKALFPKDVLIQEKDEGDDLGAELVDLLETPLEKICLPVRALNILLFMGVKKFADIPQIKSETSLLKIRNSGKKTVRDVSKMLDDFYLIFGMSYTDIVEVLTVNDWHEAKRKWIGGLKKKNLKYSDNTVNQELAIVPHIGTAIDNNNEKEKEEPSIVLTKDMIEAARTPNGGFTKSQLAAIGIEWPPPQDWINEKEGAMITPKQLEAFNHIEYVAKPSSDSFYRKGSTYKDVASCPDDRKKMEAILQAMTHFFSPATPYDIARTIDQVAWGDNGVSEESVDTYLKLLPEVEYVKWGKYILKGRAKTTDEHSSKG